MAERVQRGAQMDSYRLSHHWDCGLSHHRDCRRTTVSPQGPHSLTTGTVSLTTGTMRSISRSLTSPTLGAGYGTGSISGTRAALSSMGAATARLFLHSAPGSASNAATLTSPNDPVRGSARGRAGSTPIARGCLALRLALRLRPHPISRLNHRIPRKCFATSDTRTSRGSRRKAGSCCPHSMARTTVSTRH
jgi:hypothetical protein